jgi:predicted regulator of Ras-like GTPase activity (Roadblock/LC7/MglB family)
MAIDKEHSPMSRNEQILYILQGLVGRSQDVEGAMLVTLDGLPLASALPQGADEDRVAAMAAAALSMGARTTAELRRGSLEQVLVKGDSGYVVIISAGKETVLAAISNGEAKLGMILYEMKLAARDLARELG